MYLDRKFSICTIVGGLVKMKNRISIISFFRSDHGNSCIYVFCEQDFLFVSKIKWFILLFVTIIHVIYIKFII